MCVGSRPPKKAVTLSLFSSFGENVSKWVPKWEGAEVPKTALFLIGPPLGAPGSIVIAFCTPWAAFWHLLGSFLLSFAVPGHHFGTLGPHQNDSQRVQNSMKMNPHTTPAVFIFVEFWSPWASFWHPWAHHYKVFHNVICSCVRCIMQHSRNRSRTTREPKIQCKRILKPTWQGSFLLNFEFHEYHIGTLAKCNLFLCPLHHAAQ